VQVAQALPHQTRTKEAKLLNKDKRRNTRSNNIKQGQEEEQEEQEEQQHQTRTRRATSLSKNKRSKSIKQR
jgi:hypothetical protein